MDRVIGKRHPLGDDLAFVIAVYEVPVQLVEQVGIDNSGRRVWSPGDCQIEQRPDGMMSVRLSGKKIVEVLYRLAWVGLRPGVEHPYGIWYPSAPDIPVAVRVYDVIAAVVDQVDPGNPTGELPPAVLDDRPGAAKNGD